MPAIQFIVVKAKRLAPQGVTAWLVQDREALERHLTNGELEEHDEVYRVDRYYRVSRQNPLYLDDSLEEEHDAAA